MLKDFVSVWNDHINFPSTKDIESHFKIDTISLRKIRNEIALKHNLIDRRKINKRPKVITEKKTYSEILEYVKDIETYPTLQCLSSALGYKSIRSLQTTICTLKKKFGDDIPSRKNIGEEICLSKFISLYNNKEIKNSEIQKHFNQQEIYRIRRELKDKIILERHFGKDTFDYCVEKIVEVWNDKENFPTIESLKIFFDKTHVGNFSSLIRTYKIRGKHNFINRTKKEV